MCRTLPPVQGSSQSNKSLPMPRNRVGRYQRYDLRSGEAHHGRPAADRDEMSNLMDHIQRQDQEAMKPYMKQRPTMRSTVVRGALWKQDSDPAWLRQEIVRSCFRLIISLQEKKDMCGISPPVLGSNQSNEPLLILWKRFYRSLRYDQRSGGDEPPYVGTGDVRVRRCAREL